MRNNKDKFFNHFFFKEWYFLDQTHNVLDIQFSELNTRIGALKREVPLLAANSNYGCNDGSMDYLDFTLTH